MIKSAQDVCLRANFTSVLIVDDHPLFSEALATTLAAILPFKKLRTAGSLTEALDILACDFTPDAIVLDLYLPDVSGVKGLLRLKAAVPLSFSP
ncbi:MAG: response regulator [Thalassobaculaceae bacterium]